MTKDGAIRELAAEGASFGLAAEALGESRNTVAGLARRLGVRFACSPALYAARLSAGAFRGWARLDPVARERRLTRTVARAWAVQRRSRAG